MVRTYMLVYNLALSLSLRVATATDQMLDKLKNASVTERNGQNTTDKLCLLLDLLILWDSQ